MRKFYAVAMETHAGNWANRVHPIITIRDEIETRPTDTVNEIAGSLWMAAEWISSDEGGRVSLFVIANDFGAYPEYPA